MAAQLGIQRVKTSRHSPKLDYLTVHTPLTPETRNLIDVEELELLKPGAPYQSPEEASITKPHLFKASNQANWVASRWMCLRTSRAPTALCLASLVYCVPLIWARARRKPKLKWQSRLSSSSLDSFNRVRSATRLTLQHLIPRRSNHFRDTYKSRTGLVYWQLSGMAVQSTG